MQLFSALSSHLWCISCLWPTPYPRQSGAIPRDFTTQIWLWGDLLAQLIIMIDYSYRWALVWEALAFSASPQMCLINCRVKLISFQLCSRIISTAYSPQKKKKNYGINVYIVEPETCWVSNDIVYKLPPYRNAYSLSAPATLSSAISFQLQFWVGLKGD